MEAQPDVVRSKPADVFSKIQKKFDQEQETREVFYMIVKCINIEYKCA